MATKHKYIVAIDFGTTYTGVSYLLVPADKPPTFQFANPTVLSGWGWGSDDPKVPSKIHYCPDGKILWGFHAHENADAMGMLKLTLLEDEDVPAHAKELPELNKTLRQMAGLDKKPLEVVSDYLHHVWKQFLSDVDRHSTKLNPLGSAPLELIFTVPAIWPEYYRGRLEKAAKMAGIICDRPGVADTTWQFLTEPEAAAHQTIQDEYTRGQFKLGDMFMVVDCGGATIDIITYQVISMDPLLVKEAIPGEGSLFGACILDHHFAQHLRELYRGRISWARIEQDKQGLHMSMIQQWEMAVKRRFRGLMTGTATFMPMWKAGAGNSRRDIPAEELCEVFEQVKDGILSTIGRQIKKLEDRGLPPLSFLQLAGGFGRSQYIREFCEEALKESSATVISQRDGGEPWAAIVRGAALYGLTGHSLVQSRAIRDSFALLCDEEWDGDVHDERDQTFDRINKKYIARDQLKWFVNKGEHVEANGTRDYSCSFSWTRERGHRQFSQPLFTSNLSSPPTSLSAAEESDPSFKLYATMDFSTPVVIEELPSRGSRQVLDYDLSVEALSGKAVMLTARWQLTGQRIGRAHMHVKDDE